VPDAGVIEDARGRQRRHRRAGVGILLVAAVAALIPYFAAGGADGGTATSVRTATGSVRSVSLHTPGVGLFVGPNLGGGQASICLTGVEGGGLQGSCGAYPLPQAGLPLEGAYDIVPRGRVTPSSEVFILLAAPDVAAVRVGDLGTVRVQDAAGLPPGDHAIVFREVAASAGVIVPPGTTPQWIRRFVTPRRAIVLTALDRSGNPLPFSAAALAHYRPTLQSGRDTTTNVAHSRCAVTGRLPGLTLQTVRGLTNVAAEPYTGPGALRSCVWQTYRFDGKRFQVAVLLDATAPGTRPGPIWDATPLAGHPGIVAVQHAPSTPDNALVARRVGNAWLAAAPWVGYPGYPTLAQRLQVLAALRITRLDLSHP
jgi:hypothetical protein